MCEKQMMHGTPVPNVPEKVEKDDYQKWVFQRNISEKRLGTTQCQVFQDSVNNLIWIEAETTEYMENPKEGGRLMHSVWLKISMNLDMENALALRDRLTEALAAMGVNDNAP